MSSLSTQTPLPKTLLVIEDEASLRLVIQITLERLGGWIVLTAASGNEGLQQAHRDQPDAILLDVMMPDMDGLTVLQQLRSQLSTQTIPVILLTAKIMPIAPEEQAQLGVSGIIAKPFDPLQLSQQVSEILHW
ncbi:MAG: two-component system response regulator [Alkalinema sp. CACIAM 70d]|nr:MAG: two-component system response regulator [Alkalinema sp. CACIAM 70d]